MILHHISAYLQTVYRLGNLPPLDRFLIGAEAAQRLAGRTAPLPPDLNELLLLRQRGAELEVGLYIAPSILAALAEDDPYTCLHEGNVGPLCIAIEGISHLCCILWKFLNAVPATQLELEIQAEVDKFICCATILREQAEGFHLHDQLFARYRLVEGITAEQSERYHLASELAYRFCRQLQASYLRSHRLAALHRSLQTFYRLSPWGKLRAMSGAFI
ncbi:MAG: hypothetical protein HYV03_01955 [Deltaproteobacteria bacterium]|nr:hypothetical protein [Deltaproteobacteria bacterium]